MPIVPSAFVDQAKIATAVRKAQKALRPDVVRILYNLGEDWSGAAAAFFRIVLSDDASHKARLREITQRVAVTIVKEVKPEELGLQAYFNFRSVSEQDKLKEESWA